MWYYHKGNESDFEGWPDTCLMIARETPDGPLLDRERLPPGAVHVVAHREWVTDEGWIDWQGGECSLEGGNVDVRLRSGRFIFYRSAPWIGGNWVHDGGRRDIVAYRVCPKPDYMDWEDEGPIPF
ncbi:MAG: hypothetical protein H2067_20345 [Alcanivorax sp.]|nr:hypothetical protein [Alcanivorax sp.]